MKRKSLGNYGEKLAVKLLKTEGYKIITRNFRSRYGEIDIVALDQSVKANNKTLVFVEVKTRWSIKFGSPEEAITPLKISRIIKTGEYFQLVHQNLPESVRLDAIVIDLTPQGDLERIEHLKNITG